MRRQYHAGNIHACLHRRPLTTDKSPLRRGTWRLWPCLHDVVASCADSEDWSEAGASQGMSIVPSHSHSHADFLTVLRRFSCQSYDCGTGLSSWPLSALRSSRVRPDHLCHASQQLRRRTQGLRSAAYIAEPAVGLLKSENGRYVDTSLTLPSSYRADSNRRSHP